MAYVDKSFEARRNQILGKSAAPSGSLVGGSQYKDPSFEQRRSQVLANPIRVTQSPQQAPQPIAQSQPLIAKPRLDKKQEAIKFAANTALNFASGLSKATEFAGNLLGKNLVDAVVKSNPVSALASLAVPTRYKKLNDQWKDYFKKNEQKLPAAQVSKALEKLQRNDYLQPSPAWQQSDIKAKFSKDLIAETILQVSPSIASSILTTLATGPTGLFAVTAGSTAQDVKSDAINFGVSEGKAETLGLATGLAVGWLDKALPSKLFGDEAVKQAFLKGIFRKLGNSVLLEAGTEVTQEAVQLAAEKTFRDDLGWSEAATRTALSAFGGALGGGALQGVASFFNNTRKEIINDDQTMIDYLKETSGSSTLTPQQAMGTIVGTPLENTPEGNEIMKVAIQAQNEDKQVKITTSEGKVTAEIVEATEPVIEENKQLIEDGLAKIQSTEEAQPGDTETVVEPEPVKKRAIIKIEKMEGVENASAIKRPDGTAGIAIVIEKEYQGKGLGKEALQKLEAKLVEEGITLVRPSVFEESIGFFEKQGYKAVEGAVIKDHMLLMEKTLESKKEQETDLPDLLESKKSKKEQETQETETKPQKTPKYLMEYLQDNGIFTEGRFKDNSYPKNFVAKSDIPNTAIKAGDRVAIVEDKINPGQFSAILDKPGTDGGFKISREYGINPVNFSNISQAPKPQKTVEKAKAVPQKAAVSKKPDTKQELTAKYKENQQAVEKPKEKVKQPKASNSNNAANTDTFQDLPIVSNEKRADKSIVVPFPEMVALANELMGKYPVVKAKPGSKFGGQVRGMFVSGGNGEIRLNAAIFSDVNQAAKTLAHEMGHLADYIPDKTLKRGNLLGRIGSMTKFMRGFFTNAEVEEKIDTLVAERKAAQEARRLLPPKENRSSADKEKDKGYLADIRQINKEIKKLQENAIKNKDVFKELWNLSKQWRPLQQQQTMINVATGKPEIVTVEITEEQADDEYLSYRKSSRELYADALSVLLNDPARIRESAPTFWKKFIEQLDRKPILKENLFATWDLLNEPQDVILERRLNQIYKGYGEAKQKRLSILDEQKPKRSFVERVMQNHITVFDPIYRKLDKKFKEAGVTTSPKAKLRMQLEEMQMRRNESYLYIDSMINDISTPLKEIGLSEDDLGALLQLERGLGDRKDIANPYGLQGNFSQETLDYLQTYLAKHRNISKEQFNVLQQVAKKFREYTFSKVEAAADVGVYSQKFFNETAKPNKDTYATYQVIEYIHDNYVSAGIKHAIGTVKPIENPVVSTLLKTMAVIEQVELQKGKLAVIEELRANFPGDISDARAIRPQGVRVGWRPEKNKVSLEYYKDGAKAAVNVDPYIAQMFEVYTPTEMHTAVQVSSAFNRVFKPLVTTYNLSWGFYSNIIRDTKRTYKNLGAILPRVGKKQGLSIFEYMYRWVNSIPEGKNFQEHKITPLLKEMLTNKAFSMPFTGYDSMANEAEWLKPIIKRYAPLGDDAKQTGFKSKVLRPIAKIFKGIEYVGSVMETTSKVAGYQIVKKRLESGREAGFITRNYVGTPNYIDGGTQKQIDNNIFVFSNVMLQALRNDIEIATNPTTKSGYWFKTMQVDILPKLIMLAGAAGLFGEIVKELYSKATEYDKTNYIIVPLGMRANGKASYLRIPQDETGRLFSAIAWKLGTYMMGDLKKPNQVISLMAGFLPSTTPLWSIGGGWLNYVQGRNPYDDYRGRLVIDDTTWSAGGLPRITKMIQWTLGSAGVWQFDTYDDATDTTTDFLLKSIPVINRAIKSTDYGLTEKEQQVEKEIDKQSAQRILKERASLQDAINKTRSNPDQKYEVGKQLIKDVLGDSIESSTDKRRRTNLIKKYEIGLLKGSISREMDSLIEADTNAYKLELLKLYKRTLPASEYHNLKKTAVDNKVISDELRKEYLKMGL